MENTFAKWAAGEIFSDPLIQTLAFLFIMGIGVYHTFIIIWKLINRAKGIKEKEVITEEKGHWKTTMEGVLKELKIRNERGDKIQDAISDIKKMVIAIQEKVTWIKDVHNHVDDEGRYVWYHRKSLETSIEKLAESISVSAKVQAEATNHQTVFFEKIHSEQKETRSDIADLKRVGSR